jgi:hypothetical protein
MFEKIESYFYFPIQTIEQSFIHNNVNSKLKPHHSLFKYFNYYFHFFLNFIKLTSTNHMININNNNTNMNNNIMMIGNNNNNNNNSRQFKNLNIKNLLNKLNHVENWIIKIVLPNYFNLKMIFNLNREFDWQFINSKTEKENLFFNPIEFSFILTIYQFVDG